MIPIRNVYYMLSYAFQALQEQGYQNILTEKFDNTAELFAAILSKGISFQLKRGLNRMYIAQLESMSSVRGKINITDSIKTRSILKTQLVCSYDEFSENSELNRIIKTTVLLLLKSEISKKQKKDLRQLMVYFSNVDTLEVHNIDWNIRYDRNNQTYHLLISICYLVIKGLLHSQVTGETKLMNFLDEQRMCRLYEKFILEYYKKHYSLSASAEQIPWQLDTESKDMLPVMQSDIILKQDNNILIIDAKYYSHTTQVQYDTHTLHSANIYQIFTYVKNKEAELKDKPHNVSGMLLYAKTDETIYPNNSYQMSGNRIDVKTLDLNCDFSKIKEQLDDIVKAFFANYKDA